MIDFCIITVNFNNTRYISYLIDTLSHSATLSTFHIFVLDNNSKDIYDLENLCSKYNLVTLIKSEKNLGFCKGNNTALQKSLELNPKAILFLNPDAFLTAGWLDKAKRILDDDSIGVLSGPLWHFDFDAKKPTGLIDSLGIDVTWYGKWFDMG